MGRPRAGSTVEDLRAQPGEQQQEEEQSRECLACLASTETGFHNHTET